jgi:hypothetical protein
MKISHLSLAQPSRLQPVQLMLLASAAIMAISMLAFYVQLLNESILRGQQFRVEQRVSAVKPPKVFTASIRN